MLKIICIEDNVQEVYLIKHFLTEKMNENFHFDSAPSLKESFVKMEKENFDIAILDLGLHDSVGVITITKFKAMYPNTPVIVFSGDMHAEAIESAIKAGADAFISKNDSHPSEIVPVIEMFQTIRSAS